MTKGNHRGSYVAFIVLTLAFLLLAAFCYEMPKEKYVPSSVLYENKVFYFFQIGAILLGALLILVGHFRYVRRPCYVLLAALTVLFIGNACGLRFERIASLDLKGKVFEFSTEDKWKFAIAYFLNIEVLYLLFGVLPGIRRGKHSLNGVLAAIAISVLFMCIWSFINEWNIYSYYLQGANAGTRPVTKSLTSLKNFWGMALFAGALACVIGQARTRHLWWFIPMIAILFAVIFSFAKTTCTAVLFLYLLYVIYTSIREWKGHRWISILCIAITALMVTVIILCFVAGNIQFLAPMKKFLDAMIKNFETGSTLTGRDAVTKSFFQMIRQQPSAYVFGFGNYTFNFSFSFANSQNPWFHTHNAWLESLARGGMIRFVVFVLLVAYFLFVLIRGIIKNKRWWYFVALAGLISYGLVSWAEFVSPMDSDVWGILVSLALVVPVLHDHRAGKLGIENEPEPLGNYVLKPFHLRVGDFLLMGMVTAVLMALFQLSIIFLIVGIILQIGVLLLAFWKEKEHRILVGACIVGMDSVTLLFAGIAGAGVYPVLSGLVLSSTLCLALLYAVQERLRYGSYLLDACDFASAFQENRIARHLDKKKGYTFI